jgi:ankyrin repeat protein
MISALLEAHANPNAHDRYGITALIDAVMGQEAEIVEILAEHPGVDVNQQACPAGRLCHMLAIKISPLTLTLHACKTSRPR